MRATMLVIARKLCGVVPVLLLMMMFGCGGGGGEESFVPVTQSPTKPALAPVPVADLVENVNILINQSHVTLHPELANDALYKAVVDELNAVIARDPNNPKRYAFGKLIVYPDSDFNHVTDNISGNPAYIQANNTFVGNPSYGGTSVVLWYHTGAGQLSPSVLPKFFVDNGSGTGYSGLCSINGKTHSVAYVAMLGSEDYLLAYSDSVLTYVNGFSVHDASLGALLHELGHSYGASMPEEYSLNFIDESGTLPNLGTYDFSAMYPNDPMTGADILIYNILYYKYSDFNSWLISHNANHQLNLWQIASVVTSMTVKVKVVDASNNPVSGATVKSYGAVAASGESWGVTKNMKTLLETLTTDSNGLATVTNDFNTAWFVKGIKAYSGSRVGKGVLNVKFMKDTYWMLSQNEFMLTVVVQ